MLLRVGEAGLARAGAVGTCREFIVVLWTGKMRGCDGRMGWTAGMGWMDGMEEILVLHRVVCCFFLCFRTDGSKSDQSECVVLSMES